MKKKLRILLFHPSIKGQGYSLYIGPNLLQASAVEFQAIVQYDNQHFVSKDFKPRRQFLEKWVALPDGATYVALNQDNAITGMY